MDVTRVVINFVLHPNVEGEISISIFWGLSYLDIKIKL